MIFAPKRNTYIFSSFCFWKYSSFGPVLVCWTAWDPTHYICHIIRSGKNKYMYLFCNTFVFFELASISL